MSHHYTTHPQLYEPMFENDAGTVSTIDSINGATFSTSATTQGQSLTNHFRTVIRQHVIKSEHTVTDTDDLNTELIGGDKEIAVSTSETLHATRRLQRPLGWWVRSRAQSLDR